MSRLPERALDLVRATAVVSVVACHGLTTVIPEFAPHSIGATLGIFGVLLFFVHTALVLMASIERQGERPDWIAAFYTRRAFRIYPLAIAVVALVVATGDPAAGHLIPRGTVATFPAFDWPTVASNLALMQNLTGSRNILGTLWTLPIELQMYLLLPACYLAARSGAKAMAAMFVAFGAAYLLVAHPIIPAMQRLTVFAFGPCFLAGVVAYYLLRRDARPVLPSWSIGPILILSAVYLHVALAQPHRPLTWLSPMMVGVAIPFVAEPAVSRLTRLAHTICTYSYGVYLLHVPVFWFAAVKMESYPALVRVLVAVTGLIALPWAAYHLLEKPGIDAGRALVSRSSQLKAIPTQA
jgi:peptidoglycan/LPS O-acetylase OafA/YrhL